MREHGYADPEQEDIPQHKHRRAGVSQHKRFECRRSTRRGTGEGVSSAKAFGVAGARYQRQAVEYVRRPVGFRCDRRQLATSVRRRGTAVFAVALQGGGVPQL